MFSAYQALPIDLVTLSQEGVKLLACFRRDHRELTNSAFAKDSRCSIKGAFTWQVETAGTDDEIRSFVIIFRRLYMAGEKANFVSAVDVFAKAIGDNPYAKWVSGVKNSYEDKLEKTVDTRPFQFNLNKSTRKRLIDVFLNTRYAHQGVGKNEHRQDEYDECLREFNSSVPMMFWFFLKELVDCAGHIRRAGDIIVNWFDRYCEYHGIADTATSVAKDHPGIGTKEKEQVRQHRLFREKVDELAKRLWADAGSPAGGHWQFLQEAETRLNKVLGGDSEKRCVDDWS